MVWSIYFYLKYFEAKNKKYLLIAYLIAGLSVLIRQFGIVLLISSSSVFFLEYFKNWKREDLIKGLIGISFLGVFFLTYILWPRFSDESIITQQIYMQGLYGKISNILLGMPLVILIFSPFILNIAFSYIKKVKPFYLLIFLVLSLITAYNVFLYDLFPLGNILYIEKLYAKSGFRSNLSIFDNVLFKSVVSLRIGVSAAFVLVLLLAKWCKIKDYVQKLFIKVKTKELFLVLTTLGMFIILLFPKDTYDRYFLPFIVSLTLLLIIKTRTFKIYKFSYFLIFTLFLLSAILNYQYMTIQRIKYRQAGQLTELTGLVKQIEVDDTYLKYMYSLEINDSTGLKGSKPEHLDYVCYVRDYTLNTDRSVFKLVDSAEEFLKKFTDNPKIYQRKNIPTNRIKNNLDKLVINDEYFSPIYSIIGKRAFVGSWCEPEIIRPKTLSTL
jgi:4-amino-4-deoxy-L-arabinose transferase-like glycosyltransferase